MSRWHLTGQCWLCLAFSDLCLDHWLRASPQGFLALHQQDRLVSVSPAAEALGVRVGMNFSSALALCAELQIRARDASLQARLQQRLARWAYGFTPHILLAPERLLLEVSGSVKLFGGLAALLEQIVQPLNRQGICWQAGLAPTTSAAALLARSDVPLAQQRPVWQRPGDMLEAMPTALLALSTRTQQQLTRAGFRTIGQLLDQPRAALGKRFGKSLVQLLDELTGRRYQPPPTWPAPEQFESDRVFMYGLRDTALLQPVMAQLLDELRTHLLRHQQVCARICWRFVGEDKSIQQLPVGVQQAHADTAEFARLSELAMERCKFSASVEQVSLSAPLLQVAEIRSGNLFSHMQGAGEDMARLIDRLYQRFDDQQFFSLHAVAEPVPEYAQIPVRVSALDTAESEFFTQAQRLLDPLVCPWLLPSPQPLLERGEQLYWQGQLLQRVTEKRCVDSRWWSAARIRRDYYIARSKDAFYQCFFCHQRQRWFLSGCYVC